MDQEVVDGVASMSNSTGSFLELFDKYGVSITITGLVVVALCILFIYVLKIAHLKATNHIQDEKERGIAELEIMNKEREAAIATNKQLLEFVTKVQPAQLAAMERTAVILNAIQLDTNEIVRHTTSTEGNITIITNSIEHLHKAFDELYGLVSDVKRTSEEELDGNVKIISIVEELRVKCDEMYTMIQEQKPH